MAKTTKVLVSFLIGAVAGATAGILLAPEKGCKTRQKISSKVKEVKDVTMDSLKDTLNDVKKQGDCLMKKFNRRINDLQETVNELEERDADTIEDADEE